MRTLGRGGRGGGGGRKLQENVKLEMQLNAGCAGLWSGTGAEPMQKGQTVKNTDRHTDIEA